MDIETELVREQGLSEKIFCALVYVTSESAVFECGWLSPDTFINEKYAKYWKAVLTGANSMETALDMGLMVELVGELTQLNMPYQPQVYANRIAKLAFFRDALKSVKSVVTMIGSRDSDGLAAILEELRNKNPVGTQIRNIEEISQEFIDIIKTRQPAITTGIPALDRLVGGLYAKELIVIASRPGMGKTAFVTQIARNATAANKRALFFSLEMSGEQVWARMVCSLVGLEWNYVRSGSASAEELLKVEQKSRELQALYKDKLYIDDTANTLDEIHRKCIMLQPDIVIIDQMPEIVWHDPKESEVSFYGKICKYVRDRIAKKMNCPVILVHQLNRNLEDRSDKRPRLADLRFSGEIEQRADVVLLGYRADIYEGNSAEQDKVPFELFVAKNRQGRENICIELEFNLNELWFY